MEAAKAQPEAQSTTPTPAPAAAAPPASSSTSSSAFRPLNVRDALSYLDRVKVTFQDQAEVYDRFLEIMKSFKSQGIDTPGVIERVSTLFRGHPALIQGFNTFLPPGYRIECTVSAPADGAVTTITVITPLGLTTKTQITNAGATIQPVAAPSAPSAAPSPAQLNKETPAPTTSAVVPAPAQALQKAASSVPSAAHKPDLHLPLPSSAAPLGSASTQQGLATTPGAASVLLHDRPPMEFNHAINYVNKIKNRFVRDPETYKAFLEILQTYQKEGRAIQDVYAQVTLLFHAAPDLLDEFKQFLPDTSAQAEGAPPGPAPPSLQQAMSQPGTSAAGIKRPAASVGGLAGKDGAAPHSKRTKVGGASSASGPSVNAPTMQSKKEDPRTGKSKRKPVAARAVSPPYDPTPAYPASHPPYYGTANAPPSAYAAYSPPPLPPPPVPLLVSKPSTSMPDLEFFARVNAFIGSKETYQEFLKLINLFNQNLIDLTELVVRAELFLNGGGGQAIWADFRELVGWSEGSAVGDIAGRLEIEGGVRRCDNVVRELGLRREEDKVKAKEDTKLVDGEGGRMCGPSYRQLPQGEISLNCSGRDALCWDVLNDEWVSQPSWASDEGFVSHRKNPYEEALHRSEEERHEYDYHIEANLRTIALLEPIATRITIMEADERATFRLKPGLGNQSKSIYQRVIKKVYGKEQGAEVIAALHENPCVAVPIVLARLKQKDEEWKRALREWNRVWRDVDAKNFWKSLDHQAISLKANDKRTLTHRALVTEIETLKREQRPRGAALSAPSLSPPTFQLSYTLTDPSVLSDAFKLVFSYLDRTNAVSNADKDKLEAFLKQFLPLVFAIPLDDFALDLAAGVTLHDDGNGESQHSDAGTSMVDESVTSSLHASGPGGKRGGKKGAADLRKKALKNAGGPTSGKNTGGKRSKVSSPGPGSLSRGNSPAPSIDEGDTSMLEAPAITTTLSAASTILEGESVGEGYESATLANDDFGEPGSPLPNGAGDSEAVGMAESSAMAVDLPELIVPTTDRPKAVDTRRRWNFFANSNLYCILRLFQVVYSRLESLRNASVVVATLPSARAVTLNSVPSLSPSMTLGPALPGTPAATYYHRALGLCERLFDGDMDQAAFEEAIRGMFGTNGYSAFTLDKLLGGIVKTSQSAITDSRSQDLIELLAHDRAHPDRFTAQQQIFYRTQAESAIGNDENLYRIEWRPLESALSLQLLGKDSVASDDLDAAEREWGAYLEKYVLGDETPGIGAKVSAPFMRRNLASSRGSIQLGEDDFPSNTLVKSGLQCKLCLRSYKLFFVPLTEDFVHRDVVFATAEQREKVKSRKRARFQEWVEGKMVQDTVKNEAEVETMTV